MMADAKHLLDFLEGGVGMFFNVGVEFLGVEFPPMPPTGFRGQRPRLGGLQIAVDRAPPQIKTAGGLGLEAA
jgi:hypothetical protein